ncbi:DUF5325 family protein [Oceanobacillus sp. M65]|uniref:YlaF family protein n=1 Tax=Oceanobacillus jordanicus TaxID=2867266 RepID=A0AAW5B8T2_9BACI|nr:DUF5325 family protein [Oceanobacillus jordanicus]MCG3420448.1 YlaF family protein [Oceanobacillus jordanicus]
MKTVNFPMLLLACLVILMFVGCGVAIALRNVWLIVLFILLGFALMGFGISLKRRKK